MKISDSEKRDGLVMGLDWYKDYRCLDVVRSFGPWVPDVGYQDLHRYLPLTGLISQENRGLVHDARGLKDIFEGREILNIRT